MGSRGLTFNFSECVLFDITLFFRTLWGENGRCGLESGGPETQFSIFVECVPFDTKTTLSTGTVENHSNFNGPYHSNWSTSAGDILGTKSRNRPYPLPFSPARRNA